MNIHVNEIVIRIAILSLEGRVDAFSVGKLRETQQALLDDGATAFVVDLRDVTFLDSSGMAALVSLLKHARQLNGSVKLVLNEDSESHRILKLTRFDKVFEILDSIDTAVNAMSKL